MASKVVLFFGGRGRYGGVGDGDEWCRCGSSDDRGTDAGVGVAGIQGNCGW